MLPSPIPRVSMWHLLTQLLLSRAGVLSPPVWRGATAACTLPARCDTCHVACMTVLFV